MVGFSQGTMMALHVAPRRTKQIAGLVGFSGAMMGADTLQEEGRSKPPTLLVHGETDQVVPVQAMHAAVAGLQAVDIPVQSMVRPGLPHGIDPEGVSSATAFLMNAFTEVA